MLDDKICGTYWLVANSDGRRYITNGNKPIRGSSGGWIGVNNTMQWLCLDIEDHTFKNKVKLTTEDFKSAKIPEITYEDGPLEIEIVKSGKVYWYDN